MKIILTVFNQYTWPKAMSELLSNQGHEVIWLDNNSTYIPLLEFYKTSPYQTIRKKENRGGTAAWELLGTEIDNSDYFVISDSDYLLEGYLPENWDEILKEGVDKYGGQGGCGLAMLETKIPTQNPAWIADQFNLYPNGDHPARWGSQVQLPGGFINFPVDTSFAVYPPGTDRFTSSATGCRSAVCAVRHAPWHIVLDMNPNEDSLQIPFDEEYYYYLIETRKSGAYTGTTPRMANLISEYERRTGR